MFHHFMAYAITRKFAIRIPYYHFQPSRSAAFLKNWLMDFKGVAATDGFESYDTHLNPLKNAIHAGCNVHARRKFTECDKSPEAEHVLNEYAKIYKIESDLAKANAPPEVILDERKEKSLSILEGLRDKMNEWALVFRPEWNFGKTIKYFLKEYDKLVVYINHPHVRPVKARSILSILLKTTHLSVLRRLHPFPLHSPYLESYSSIAENNSRKTTGLKSTFQREDCVNAI